MDLIDGQKNDIVGDDDLTPDQVGRLIEQNMREYDEGDPLLDSYQQRR